MSLKRKRVGYDMQMRIAEDLYLPFLRYFRDCFIPFFKILLPRIYEKHVCEISRDTAIYIQWEAYDEKISKVSFWL